MHSIQPDKEVTLEGSAHIPPPVRQPRQMTTALILLCSCVAILMTGFGIIVPVYPQRLEALGLGAETLALMEGGFGLGMFLFSTPMGTLADRIGRKPIVLFSLGGFIVTNLVLALVNIPAIFILIRFVEGALISGLMPASAAIVGDAVPLEKQGRWIGFITTAQATGFAIGPGIGGFLYQAWGFSSPFFISAGGALVASLLALIMLPETLSEQVREEARHRQANKGQESKKTKSKASGKTSLLWFFIPLLTIDFCMTFVYPFVLPQYPFYFQKVLGYNAAQYGVIISAYGGALAVFPMLLGGLSERFTKKQVILVGSVLTSVLNIGMLFLHQYWLLIGGAIITGMGSSLLIPALSTIYLGVTTDHNRSQVMGIRGTAISLAILLAPLTQALAAHWITPQTTFAIGVAISLAIILLVMVALKNPQQPEQGQEVIPAAIPESATHL
jgi:MFS family permease